MLDEPIQKIDHLEVDHSGLVVETLHLDLDLLHSLDEAIQEVDDAEFDGRLGHAPESTQTTKSVARVAPVSIGSLSPSATRQ